MRTIVRITKRGTVRILTKTSPTRFILNKALRPAYHVARYEVVANIALWGTTFWAVWEVQPMDKKLAWLLFLNQTLAIVTLIEVFLLKSR
ncbi:hypothetical protein HY949_05420 [Candidatus Gottesmanbacteria bacterium]|nr:hypothetical protein [Candidatus Gottesmanbacteria bacterium]